MKSLLGKLGVILIGLVIFGYAEGWGADWKYISENNLGMDFYDVGSISYPSDNIVRVWVKTIWKPQGISGMVKDLGKSYENVEFSKGLREYDCREKKGRTLSMIDISKDGSVIANYTVPDPLLRWSFVSPDSVDETSFKVVCSQAKN